MPAETIDLRGHLLDNLTLPKVLDLIMAFGGDYRIEEIRVGYSPRDPSAARVRIDAPDEKTLEEILEQVTRSGATIARQPDVRFKPAPKDGVLPDDFYATTNLTTHIFHRGRWLRVENAEMDCGIVLDPRRGRARCLRMHRVRKGDPVVVGHEGIRVDPLDRMPERQAFEFMASSVSSEKPKLLAIQGVARQIRAAQKAGRKVLLVGGPAIVHTGAGPHLAALIRDGLIDVLFAGNALAAHDIEADMFGTSLGVSLESGKPVEHGHEHHLRAINRVRHAGSISAAVRKGLIKGGVMHACVRRGVPFVLVGSIRDDGPLPDVFTEVHAAQDAMRAHLPGVGVAIMIGTMLTSIAVGNMLPAAVYTVCVDINPAVVTKLADRGTFHAMGLVTDAELFLRQLARELGVREKRRASRKPARTKRAAR
ncbi:MAG: TIGR00300 family protein [Planctomycetota bacterium]|nr:TIGR00300 family protein [Planctomycetota bacterium]